VVGSWETVGPIRIVGPYELYEQVKPLKCEKIYVGRAVTDRVDAN